MFTCILAIRHTETKVEIKTFQQFLSEIMPFNHAKVLNRLVPNCKLNTERKKFIMPNQYSEERLEDSVK